MPKKGVIVGVILFLTSLLLITRLFPKSLPQSPVNNSNRSAGDAVLPDDWPKYTSPIFSYRFSYPADWYTDFLKEDRENVKKGNQILANFDSESGTGDEIGFKVDIYAQYLEAQTKQDFMKEHYPESKIKLKSDLAFGNFVTFQYETPSIPPYQEVRTYVTYIPNNVVITANVFIANKTEAETVEKSSDWQNLKEIFSSFYYMGR